MTEKQTVTDVIVVGAGPTGLLLAGDLAAAGLDVTVLEKRATESGLTRAFAVHARTLELLDARGLADELIATGRPVEALKAFNRVRIDLGHLPTRFPFVLLTPQYHTERLLHDRAVKAGATVLRGAEVTGLRQDPEGVTVETTHEGATTTHRARYAVGADGVHSTVRDLLGLPFPGESVVDSVLLADVRLEREPEDGIAAGADENCFALLVPFGDGWYRVLARDRAEQVPDGTAPGAELLADITRRALGEDYGLHDVRWSSTFHSDERQVPDYRSGRVFLAGDAAHCHSPAGGLGMNTGLQDAANLSWKLVAVLRDGAADTLLDSYQTERHPVGRAALRASGAMIRVALAQSAATRALRGALVQVAGRVDAVVDRGARTVSGLGIAYPAPKDAHPQVGKRVPDLRLTGLEPPREDGPAAPQRLYEALRAGRFVLVSNDEMAAAEPWRERLVTVAPADPHGKLRDTVLLIRPDGYTAWGAVDPGAGELRAALTEWLGEA
ncbi:FAD-dependent monooxygenase [Kitasatospora purpeofusca]|uniref:FAD-dependent monooxygenase n=1 Tax=Kitasatospora purpeofusca TaxID=67352 RepID=UPI002A598E0A|nr:FAD-dependent monooxygenase [Kitasatospora purpeofusca]MDY0812481.1 FAD-dependent monooxygenase [Kitasatospora purpeofusca]